MQRRNKPYIQDGQVVRGPSYSVLSSPASICRYYVSWKRVGWIVWPILILCLTNPANQDELLGRNRRRKDELKAFGRSSRWINPPRVTNYGIFSVEEGFDSVTLSAIQLSYKCSFRDANVGGLCQVIANNMCHRKPLIWDTNDRPYTTHRLLCSCLILSAIIRFCCPGAPPTTRLFPNAMVDDLLASPFCGSPSRLVHDIAYQTICVYPALVELNRIIPKLRVGSVFTVTGNQTWDYVLAVCVLVFGIGGGSNLITTLLTKRPVRGYASVIGASLGYYQRINAGRTTTTLMAMYGRDVTAVQAYWGSIVWIVFGRDGDWVPPLVTWLISGLAGSIMANYHLENIVLLADVFKFFGLT